MLQITANYAEIGRGGKLEVGFLKFPLFKFTDVFKTLMKYKQKVAKKSKKYFFK